MSISLVAFETSTDHCSVALYHQGEVIYRHQLAPQQHTQKILPMLDELLAEANCSRTQLDAIAFGCGPGSFTGVRLATSLAQGIAFALDLPVIPISTLRALAQQAWRRYAYSHILAVLDARLKQVYAGHYQLNSEGIMTICEPEIVCSPTDLKKPDLMGEWVGIGSGWDVYYAQLPSMKWLRQHYPHAHEVALLASYHYSKGDISNPIEVKPCYIRNQVARMTSETSV
jgi:tRNA threonylcarbamoyladenosine biosynthesis protein TsaB